MNQSQPVGGPISGGVYYGWRIVAALFLTTTALFGVALYAFIMFSAPLAEEFGWSASQTGSIVSAMWVAAPFALSMPFLLQRIEPWRLVLAGLCIQALALLSLGAIGAFWQLYGLRLLMGVGKVLIMASIPAIVGRWFDTRFSTAVAIVWAGSSAGGLALAPATEALNAMLGWRNASLILALGVFVIVGLALLLRGRAASPQALGIGRDGSPSSKVESTSDDRSVTVPLRHALRSIPLLPAAAMIVAVLGASMAAIAILSQQPTVLEKAGFSSASAAGLVATTAGAAFAGSLVIGWMLDRMPALFCSGVIILALLLGFGSYALIQPGQYVLAAAAAVATGFMIGGGEVLWITLVKRRFGDRVFAWTYGGFYLALQAGYATGGFLGGLSLDQGANPGFLSALSIMYAPAAILCIVFALSDSGRVSRST